MKVIIAGGRDFDNYPLLQRICNQVLNGEKDIEIISGTARGADSLGEQYTQDNGMKVKQFPAEWKKFGRFAGPIRNAHMAQYAGTLIVIWDGKSRGTKNMIGLAKRESLQIIIVIYDIK